jgi:hypothetical protein
MKKLKISKQGFYSMLSDLIKSGVTFEAIEQGDDIIVNFTGGY